MSAKENECPCAKLDCPRHGDCVACYGNHPTAEKTIFCLREENAHLISVALLDRVREKLPEASLAESFRAQRKRV